jgi:hypothetical protein
MNLMLKEASAGRGPAPLGKYVVDQQLWGRAMPCRVSFGQTL